MSNSPSPENGNRVALITGAAKRVGAAIAEHLADTGWAVGIHYRGSSQNAEALAARIEKKGGRAIALKADLASLDDIKALVPRCTEALGAITCLINNASTFEKDAMGALDDALWDLHFAVHTRAPVYLADAMHSALPDGQKGVVINMIDQRVWRLTPEFVSYTLSKSALWTATQTMAQALAPRTRVCAIGPGPTLPSTRQNAESFATQAKSVLLETGPTLEEVCNTVSLIIDTPSLTGQMIALDGGQHLAWQTPDVVQSGE